jgi:hypothetical protein
MSRASASCSARPRASNRLLATCAVRLCRRRDR